MGIVMNKKPVLVAMTEGRTPDNEVYSSEFRMDARHNLAVNKEFWHKQVDDFLVAAEIGSAKLVLSSDPGERLTDTKPIQATTKQVENKRMSNINDTAATTPTQPANNTIRSGAVKSEAFKILSNAPIPVPTRGRKKRATDNTYPFRDMAVGNSFTVVGKVNIQKARNAFQAFTKEHGPAWKFISRDVSGMANPDGSGVYPPDTFGVWRVMPTAEVTTVQNTSDDDDLPHHNPNAPDIVVPADDEAANETHA